MTARKHTRGLLGIGLILAACLSGTGCQTQHHFQGPIPADVPRELAKVPQPTYTLEPPDILLVDVVRLVPKPPYRVAPLDVIIIQVTGVPPEDPISGPFAIAPDGTVNLGTSYGSVPVAGMTLEEAQAAIEKQLKKIVKTPTVRVALGQAGGIQIIRGEHLVRPDGTVGLGKYGSVQVSGMTLEQAKTAMEAFLANFFDNPEVSLDVYAYNSKFYYVITDGGGYGEQIYRIPLTGNETVLDGLSQILGLPAVASKHRIWLVRPEEPGAAVCKAFPVDYPGITRWGLTATNYQLLSGDRIYVEANPLITLDTALARLFSPIERIFGVTLLGSATVHSIAVPLGSTSTGTGF
jgi:polysaccharide export outer membrane protein